MKKCSKCKVEKEEKEFYKDRSSKDGLDYSCKNCAAEQSKKCREKRPDHYREQNRKNLEKNYETIRASQKKHRIINRDRILSRRKELREPRKEEINLREKERRKNDPNHLEKARILNRKSYKKNKETLKPKRSAHQLVMYAVKLGILVRPKECEKCASNIKIEGHHEDYSRPLDVKWLCKSCHVKEHRACQLISS
jgi:hypothetical protein